MRRLCETIPVLLVEAENDFREASATLLRDDGHPVFEFASPTQLVELPPLQSTAVVIAGYPAVDDASLSFVDEFHGRHPAVPIILLTPYGMRPAAISVARRRAFVYVRHRPVEYDDLHAAIHTVFT